MACLGFAGLWTLTGCNDLVPAPQDAKQTVSAHAGAEANPVEPQFRQVEITVDAGGPTCTGTFAPAPIGSPLRYEGGSICGPAGAITELRWQYMGTTEEGDRYEFERSYPLDEPDQTTSRKEIIFKGTELFVYRDDRSTVVMRQSTARQRAEDADSVKGEKPKADGGK